MRPNGFHLGASQHAETRCIYISPAVAHIPPAGPTKEVLHSGLSEKLFRFYAYT